MLKPLFLLTSLLVAQSLHAEPPKTLLLEGNTPQRVCYYKDKAYSEGAILQVGENYLICQRANKFETNGSLKWQPLNQKSTAPKRTE